MVAVVFGGFFCWGGLSVGKCTTFFSYLILFYFKEWLLSNNYNMFWECWVIFALTEARSKEY